MDIVATSLCTTMEEILAVIVFYVKLGIWNELKFYRITNRVPEMKSSESLVLLSTHNILHHGTV